VATYFPTQNGRIKIQAETLLGTSPTNGWVYQPPGTGNNATGAQGGYYYFKSESLDGSVKSATQGLFSATVYVAEAGTYTLRVRTARDTNDPGDSRNDIWVRVDDDIHDVLPEGTVAIGATASGFGKLKGANTAWGYAKAFAAEGEEDANPPSQVVLTQGFHTITFAGRSVGLHIDFFELVKAGLNVAATAPDTAAVTGPVLPAAASVDEDASLVLDVLSGQSGYTVTAATDPAHGTTVVNADKTIRYTPDADFFGTDTFTFTVTDARGAVTTQRMTMTVAGTPDAPAAAGDTASTVKGTAVSVAVLGNDADPDGTSIAINSFDGTSTFGGTVTKVGNQLVYTPLAGFTGTDTFTYDIVDPTGRVSERATVAVAVADGPVGGLPIVVGVYDAATDALVDLLADGDVLDAAAVDGSMTFSVSVVAGSALDGQVGSVKLRLSGDASATRTESGAPYSLFGDKDGDYAGGADLGVGSYKLEVDVYSKAGAKGTLLDSFDFDFGVSETATPAPLRVGLYNADTDALVDLLEDGDVLSAAEVAGSMTFSVSAVAGGALDGQIGSVKLRLSGDATASRTETGAPYSLFGDKDGDLKGGGLSLDAGNYTFAVNVYSGAGGKGTLLDSFDYDFTVSDTLFV